MCQGFIRSFTAYANLRLFLNSGDNEGSNEGWADAMARILEKQLPVDKVS